MTAMDDAPDLGGLFRSAGVTGFLHAVDVDTGAEVSCGGDEPVVLASVFKIALMVEFFRQADRGLLDPAERVTVMADRHTPGPTGVSAMADDVTASLRDLAYLMIAVSDNTAADTLVGRVGLGAVNAMLAGFGLARTWVEHDCAGLFASIVTDSGQQDMPTDPAVISRLRALDPARTNRSTPRETARLLAMIWRDEAASPGSCGWMRRLLGLQVWPHRLASGFPYDDVAVSGKTGTLPTLRNEAGVVEYPDGGRYAVAVFTRSYGTAQNQPRADAVIGTAARTAVEHLRSRLS
ncbi:serine hydrolase [Planomonospora sp. ID67723]|uniref:serine hydrolase n=1 Tax=Planomonospora sp. ID67723 TaxID=2738134 RepID=UPI0018C3D33C|nr:serine hydrolase [Planomonospora sp. ID67723]MBG0828098.1 serine hydrolase [Planomonospora sp. ID67723]